MSVRNFFGAVKVPKRRGRGAWTIWGCFYELGYFPQWRS